MAAKTLENLFLDTLQDIYYAERQILKALPEMAQVAEAKALQKAFEKHRDQTQGHIERLQDVFKLMETPAKGKTCPAIDGILKEGKDIMAAFKGSPALDAGLIAAAQAVEHYEMARYGALRQWAKDLGWPKAEKLLDETLQEETQTGELLTKLAKSSANREADASI